MPDAIQSVRIAFVLWLDGDPLPNTSHLGSPISFRVSLPSDDDGRSPASTTEKPRTGN
jgi:hypothetical protein